MRKWRNGIVLTLVYLFTRLPFLVFRPVYYDSFEYVDRIRNVSWTTLTLAIRESHPPVHTLYIGLAGIVRIITNLPAAYVYTILSVFFGFFAVLLWYGAFLGFLRDRREALWGTMIFTLLPGFWRTSTNILYEPLLLAFQAGAMMLLMAFSTSKRKRYIIGALLCFTAAQLTFIGNIFFALPFTVLTVGKKPKQTLWLMVFLITAVAAALVIDRLVVGSWPALIHDYTIHSRDTISSAGGLIVVSGRILRNIVLITSKLTYPLAAGIAFIALWFLRRKKHIVWVAVAFLAVSFFEMQYWHAGYYGRIGILVLFPVSLILGKFLGKRSLLAIGLCIVLTINILALGMNQRKIPYITALTQYVKRFPDALFITGDYTRFAFEPKTNVFIIHDPHHDIPALEKALQTNKRVFLDKSVLTYPYNQPDGWEYQLLSKQDKVGILTDWLTKRCSLRIAYEYQSAPPLVVYEATSCNL